MDFRFNKLFSMCKIDINLGDGWYNFLSLVQVLMPISYIHSFTTTTTTTTAAAVHHHHLYH